MHPDFLNNAGVALILFLQGVGQCAQIVAEHPQQRSNLAYRLYGLLRFRRRKDLGTLRHRTHD
jgi:hypothetical protein